MEAMRRSMQDTNNNSNNNDSVQEPQVPESPR
jgi:hypothetical protein